MRIGIIGAGQLGQMLGFAAREMGHSCCFLDPAENPPARTAGPVTRARFDDAAALRDLAAGSDVLSYEFENVPVAALAEVAACIAVYPPLAALEQAQDRLAEKRLFDRLGIPLPKYRQVDTLDDLGAAADEIGLPLVVKTRRLGYDGKGQYVVSSAADLARAIDGLGDRPLIAEEWVDFDYEVSAIGVRNVAGEVATYCLTRNEHAGGILRVSRAPVEDDELTRLGVGYVNRLLEHLEYVGVLALELFVTGDRLLANEFAPRVHNSGHWTIEGAETSQFANHIRAVLNESPGSTACLGHAGMINLIGKIPDSLRRPSHGVLHDYGKTPREGRKLGHVSVVADTAGERDRLLELLGRNVTRSTTGIGTRT